jgi:hypothetical protein
MDSDNKHLLIKCWFSVGAISKESGGAYPKPFEGENGNPGTVF